MVLFSIGQRQKSENIALKTAETSFICELLGNTILDVIIAALLLDKSLRLVCSEL